MPLEYSKTSQLIEDEEIQVWVVTRFRWMQDEDDASFRQKQVLEQAQYTSEADMDREIARLQRRVTKLQEAKAEILNRGGW